MMNKREQEKELRRLAREAKQARKDDHLKNYVLKNHLNYLMTPKNVALLGQPDLYEVGEGKWADTVFYLYSIERITSLTIENKIPLRINQHFMQFFEDRPYAFFNIIRKLSEEMRGAGFEEVLKKVLIHKKFSSLNELLGALQCSAWWVEWFDKDTVKDIYSFASSYNHPVVQEVANQLIIESLKNRHHDILQNDSRLSEAL